MFHLIGGIALERQQLNVLDAIKNIESNETFFSHNVFPIYKKFKAMLNNKKETKQRKNFLVEIFMNNLCASSYYPTFDEFNLFIKPVM